MKRVSLVKPHQIQYMIVLEIALGTTVSILLADMIGLKFSAVAGITTLLTIQNTVEDTLITAIKRYLAFALMVFLCWLIFIPFRFHTLSFGLFLLVFVGLCYTFDMQAVVASNAVLATHFLIEQTIVFPLIINEFGLLFIGSAVGILVKVLIPRRPAPLKHFRDEIEEIFRYLLRAMSSKIMQTLNINKASIYSSFDELEKKLSGYEITAMTEVANKILPQNNYPVLYFQMRSRQASFMRRIWNNLERTQERHDTNNLLATFLSDVAEGFHERNNAKEMLCELDRIDEKYDLLPLPATRQEFEDRALLYAVIQDFRTLLEIKRDFMASVDETEISKNW